METNYFKEYVRKGISKGKLEASEYVERFPECIPKSKFTLEFALKLFSNGKWNLRLIEYIPEKVQKTKAFEDVYIHAFDINRNVTSEMIESFKNVFASIIGPVKNLMEDDPEFEGIDFTMGLDEEFQKVVTFIKHYCKSDAINLYIELNS